MTKVGHWSVSSEKAAARLKTREPGELLRWCPARPCRYGDVSGEEVAAASVLKPPRLLLFPLRDTAPLQ